MTELWIERVYSIDPDGGTLAARDGQLVEASRPKRNLNYDQPFMCRGLNKYDLACFGQLVTIDAMTQFDGLVLSSGQHGSIVTPSSYLERNLAILTPEVARKLASLARQELDQLSISEHVLDYTHRRFPGAKPLD